MKKMYRWLLAAVMVLALCVGAVACGSEENSEETDTTTIKTEDETNSKEEEEPEMVRLWPGWQKTMMETTLYILPVKAA